MQAPNKAVEGKQHPDRNAQFEHINKTAETCLERGVPVISVDTKKKELVGNFKNGGREWQPQDEPELVDVHDFPQDAIGKAIPYGGYDVGANDGSGTDPEHYEKDGRIRRANQTDNTRRRNDRSRIEAVSFRPHLHTGWSGDVGSPHCRDRQAKSCCEPDAARLFRELRPWQVALIANATQWEMRFPRHRVWRRSCDACPIW